VCAEGEGGGTVADADASWVGCCEAEVGRLPINRLPINDDEEEEEAMESFRGGGAGARVMG
jgi:hypothetical protein